MQSFQMLARHFLKAGQTMHGFFITENLNASLGLQGRSAFFCCIRGQLLMNFWKPTRSLEWYQSILEVLWDIRKVLMLIVCFVFFLSNVSSLCRNLVDCDERCLGFNLTVCSSSRWLLFSWQNAICLLALSLGNHWVQRSRTVVVGKWKKLGL